MGFWDRLTTRLFSRDWVCDWEETDPKQRMTNGDKSGSFIVTARSFHEAQAKARESARSYCKKPMLKVRRAYHWDLTPP